MENLHRNTKLYSNEIVFRGHPDKVCDQISAAIGDGLRRINPYARYGIETAGGKGKIFITGEVDGISGPHVPDVIKKEVPRVLDEVGYRTDYEIIDNIGRQSADISLGVSRGGAGDQGMVFGYATNETPELLPKAQVILQKIAEQYDELRRRDPRFKPDGKAQITGEYIGTRREAMILQRIKTLTISYQNTEKDRAETDKIIQKLAEKVCLNYDINIKEFLINPTGMFEIGGFEGDAGLTGRKIVVDAYQSFANVGGGCMNGKDATKVDFSAAHKAREIAKQIVKDGENWAEVQISYAIGVAEPLAIYISTDAGIKDAPAELYEECTPERIIQDLGLRRIKYEPLAQFGHFRN